GEFAGVAASRVHRRALADETSHGGRPDPAGRTRDQHCAPRELSHALYPAPVADETTSFAVDGLLLDCDGVLVDSHDAAAVAWNQWAKRWVPGFDFHRDIEHGRRIGDLVAELISNPGDVATAVAELTQHELDCATDVRSIPGARQLLD